MEVSNIGHPMNHVYLLDPCDEAGRSDQIIMCDKKKHLGEVLIIKQLHFDEEYFEFVKVDDWGRYIYHKVPPTYLDQPKRSDVTNFYVVDKQQR